MHRIKSVCLAFSSALITVFVVTGCASQGVSRGSLNEQISISYATVIAVEEVSLKSDVGKSAAIGGLWGLFAGSRGNHKDMLGGALTGAALMGATTKIVEGSTKAYAYNLRGMDNREFKVMTEQDDIKVEDCVAVESGTHTNLRRVSVIYCQPQSQHAGVETELQKKEIEAASQCHQAKEQLLAAKPEEVDAWVRKVKALCDN